MAAETFKVARHKRSNYVTIEKQEDYSGFSYTIYDGELNEIEEGTYEDASASVIDVLRWVAEFFGLTGKVYRVSRS